MIPWASPYLDDQETSEVMAALRAGRIGMGARVEEFERQMASLVRRKHAVAVTNGTVALDLALKALSLGPGDEVIVPAMSYIATLNAVLYQGATPRFADLSPTTYTVDPARVAELITPRTKAIVLMDYGGQPCAHRDFQEISAASNVPLILDGAQSLGGFFDGVPLCKFGLVSTTSFHVAKAITAVEGGMVFTDVDEIATTVRLLRGQGEDPLRKYHHVALGYNARLSDLHAAIGLAQLRKYAEIFERRAALSARYTSKLEGSPGIELPWASDPAREASQLGPDRPGERRGWFLFPVLVDHRDAVAEFLREHGVDTRICYPLPLYEQPFYARRVRETESVTCPIAERYAKRVLNLPLYHGLRDEQVDEISELLGRAVEVCAT